VSKKKLSSRRESVKPRKNRRVKGGAELDGCDWASIRRTEKEKHRVGVDMISPDDQPIGPPKGRFNR